MVVTERANLVFPFAIAVVLPPAGLLLGLLALSQDEPDQGARLLVVSVLAAVIWAFLLFG